jgi:hypothetical protein
MFFRDLNLSPQYQLSIIFEYIHNLNKFRMALRFLGKVVQAQLGRMGSAVSTVTHTADFLCYQ